MDRYNLGSRTIQPWSYANDDDDDDDDDGDGDDDDESGATVVFLLVFYVHVLTNGCG